MEFLDINGLQTLWAAIKARPVDWSQITNPPFNNKEDILTYITENIGSMVSVSQKTATGSPIAVITVGGKSTTLYAPTASQDYPDFSIVNPTSIPVSGGTKFVKTVETYNTHGLKFTTDYLTASIIGGLDTYVKNRRSSVEIGTPSGTGNAIGSLSVSASDGVYTIIPKLVTISGGGGTGKVDWSNVTNKPTVITGVSIADGNGDNDPLITGAELVDGNNGKTLKLTRAWLKGISIANTQSTGKVITKIEYKKNAGSTGKAGQHTFTYTWGALDSSYGCLLTKPTADQTISNSKKLTNTGAIYASGFFESSDKRLKKDITSVPADVKESAGNVKIRSFRLKKDESFHVGVVAQEMEKVGLGCLVGKGGDGHLAVDYISFLCARIAALEDRIAALEGKDK